MKSPTVTKAAVLRALLARRVTAVLAAEPVEAGGRFLTEGELLAAVGKDPGHNFSAMDRIRDEAAEGYRATVSRFVDAAEADALRKRQHETADALLILWLMLMRDEEERAYATAADRLGALLPERAMGSNQGFETEAAHFAEERQALLHDFPDHVRSTLARAMGAAEAEGLLPRRAREKVRAAAEALKRGRGEVIAQTEAQATYGSAQLRVLRRAGYTTVQWTTMADEKVRPSHVDCEAQGPVPLGQPFANGLRYPGDPNGGPEEVANCRCWLTGVSRERVHGSDTGQRRAKPGGEYGPNGEWYDGGKWIATHEDRVKQSPSNIRPTRRLEIEPGKWEEAPSADHLSVYRSLAGVEIFDRQANKFSFNPDLSGSNYASPEAIANRKARIESYNSGERWFLSPAKKMAAHWESEKVKRQATTRQIVERLIETPKDQWGNKVGEPDPFYSSLGNQLNENGSLSEKQARHVVNLMLGSRKKANAEQWDAMFQDLTTYEPAPFVQATRHPQDITLTTKCIVRDDRGRVLVLRDRGGNFLDLPGGHARSGETPEEAVRREVTEETGLTLGDLSARGSFQVELKGVPTVVQFFQAHALTGEVRLSDEHSAYRWLLAPEVHTAGDLGVFRLPLLAAMGVQARSAESLDLEAALAAASEGRLA